MSVIPRDFPGPDYKKASYWLANMHHDGGYSSDYICDLVDILEPEGWGGSGEQRTALHALLVAMLRAEPWIGLNLQYAVFVSKKLAELP